MVLPGSVQLTMTHVRAVEAAKEALDAEAKAAAKRRIQAASNKSTDPEKVRSHDVEYLIINKLFGTYDEYDHRFHPALISNCSVVLSLERCTELEIHAWKLA